VFIPKSYKSSDDKQAFSCSLKTNDGLLFPLEKQMLFINKPAVLIKYEDIEQIEFKRYIPNAHSGATLCLHHTHQ
jgi:structure-specific recognition protein 1